MLMVIFGAGASYDSSPTYRLGSKPSPGAREDARPPLARELFANRPLFAQALDHYPQCKPIVPRLRAPAVVSGDKPIESVLGEIEDEAVTYPRGPQELAAVRYYLQRAITDCQAVWLDTTRGITNYLSLLREIERTRDGTERVCLVTFNYDTLLEYAIASFGYKFEKMEDYIEGLEQFHVFKLHGSVNWGQRVGITLPANVNLQHSPTVQKYLIDHAAEIRVSSDFVLCNPSTIGVVNKDLVFPAIAIPVEKKNQFVCPKTLIEQLVQVLPLVSKILVVGWRATEDHFLGLLGNRLTGLRRGVRLNIVGGDDAEQISVRFHRALLNNRPNSSTDSSGFTDFLESGRAKSFLES